MLVQSPKRTLRSGTLCFSLIRSDLQHLTYVRVLSLVISIGTVRATIWHMAQNELVQEVLSKTTDRRRMLQRLATAGAAIGATMATGSMEAQTSGPSAVDVLQFALNLEYLEAEFYSIATTGQTLTMRGYPVTGSGTAGATTSVYIGQSVAFSPGVGGPAINIATDEINHVVLLRTALAGAGVTPIAKPAINLDALLSQGAGLGNQASFLVLARIFEDIGVSAYGGAAQFLAGTPYLTTAARILAVEGEHVANIRYQIARLGIPTTAIDAADVPPPSSLSANSTLGTPAYFFSTNIANGLTAIRTPGQVLYLAYGNAANAKSGGFFPNGANGTLNTSSSPATAANLT